MTVDDDIDNTLQEIIEKNGFIYEEHYVRTADGYIL
jgi:hypothetical protein